MPFDSHHECLALDFDGVIADSIEECLVVGHNAYMDYQGRPNKISQLSELNRSRVEKAIRLRDFIRSGEDYVYIQMALDQGIIINSQQEFDEFLNKNKSLQSPFFDHFYRERTRLSENQTDLWTRLNPLYKGMRDYLIDFRPKSHFFIITTKKIEYAYKILKGNGIDFSGENGFHASGRRTKKTIIEDILGIKNIDPQQFHFIDDQVDTLLKVKSTGIQVYLAAWGYNNAVQQDLARQSGISVLTLEKFHATFTGRHGR